MTVIDFSDQALDVDLAWSMGVRGFIGYLSSVGTVNGQPNPKIWTPAKLRRVVELGGAAGFVYEDGAADMVSGASGGYRSASVAVWELASLFAAAGFGDPTGTESGVYFADDHNTPTPGAGAYMKSAAAVLDAHGLRPGYYGNETGAVFLLDVGVTDLGWGVSTWGADTLRRCALRQEANTPQVVVAGVAGDVDTPLAADWGQYPRP